MPSPGSLTTQPYGSPRKPSRCTLRCWPASQPWVQALCRHAHGGIMPDPDLKPDSDDDDTPRVKIPPPLFKGLPGERPDAHIYAAEDWMEAMRFREDQYIDKFKHTLNHLA